MAFRGTTVDSPQSIIGSPALASGAMAPTDVATAVMLADNEVAHIDELVNARGAQLQVQNVRELTPERAPSDRGGALQRGRCAGERRGPTSRCGSRPTHRGPRPPARWSGSVPRAPRCQASTGRVVHRPWLVACHTRSGGVRGGGHSHPGCGSRQAPLPLPEDHLDPERDSGRGLWFITIERTSA